MFKENTSVKKYDKLPKLPLFTYVFVKSNVPETIGIWDFPSMSVWVNAKKHVETHR